MTMRTTHSLVSRAALTQISQKGNLSHRYIIYCTTIGLISSFSLTPGYYIECLSLSSPSVLSTLSFEGKVVEARVREEEESQEAEEALVLAGRVLLAAQAPRNLLPHTVLEVVKCPPFPQVNCLQDVHLVEARDPKFLGIGLLSFDNTFIHCLFFFTFRQYGSGYPGIAGRGVAGRGFPFLFWPLAWGGVAGVGTAAYLHNTEVGDFVI